MEHHVLTDILLLSKNESLASVDRRALRDAGAQQIRVMTSGVQAARELAAMLPPGVQALPDAVVCGQTLADMDGEQFCAIIRLHPRLLGLPILLVLANDTEREQLATLGCGASALLARPYAIPELKRRLIGLAGEKPDSGELLRAARLTDTREFDKALITYGALLKRDRKPEDYFRVGMQCLRQSSWNNAIDAFQKALKSQVIKGEAELGIACAWKGKGDQRRFRAWLGQAANTFVCAQNWHRARITYARLLREDPSAKNPFLNRARQLIHQGQYDEAANTLAQGYEVSPQKQIRTQMAQTCMGANEPGRMLRLLEASLERNGIGERGLNEDLKKYLDSFVRQKEQHRRQESARRQAEMSRRLADQKKKDDAGVESETAGNLSQGASRTPAAASASGRSRGSSMTAPRLEDIQAPALENARPEPGAGEGGGKRPQILLPLTADDAASGLFTSLPRLNDLLSVMKCTWKLSRRN